MKNINKSFFAILSVFLLLFIIALPATAGNQVVVHKGVDGEKTPSPVPKVTSKIVVNGVLDEDVWQQALLLKLDYEMAPGYNIKPPVRTELLLAYSESHLYVAFKAYDPDPSAIRARFTDRDNFAGDDWVAVLLDTFNDSRRSFNLCCNPYGIQADMIESTAGGGHKWDTIWDSAGKITDLGYVIEMAIPFSSLRFQKTDGDQVWRIDAMRGYPRSSYHTICLFPVDRSSNCRMCTAEKLKGFKGVNQGKNIEFDPTLSYMYNRKRAAYTKNDFVTNENKIDAGFSFRWSINPSMTLNAAINPDFSNVEADSALMDVNTQFTLDYPEKRPFFLEGFSLFNTRLKAVNTRAFSDPDWGIKLSGKVGRSAIGLFTAQDSITNLVFPGKEASQTASIPMNTIGTVARYRMDISRSSNIGVLLTDREGDDYFNRMAGVDLDLRITRKDRISIQFLGSQTRYPGDVATKFKQPEDQFWGTALDMFYYHNTKHFDWFLSYKDIGADFRADLGFMPQTDFRAVEGGLLYTWLRRAGGWFTKIGLGSGYRYEFDHQDNLMSKTARVWLDYTGPMQSFLNLQGNIGKKTLAGNEFDFNRLTYNIGLQSGRYVFSVNGVVGDDIDIWNVRQGTVLSINPTLDLKAGKHLYAQLNHNFERLKIDRGRLYTANITNFKLVYHFNRKTFVRGIVQYVNHDFNADLYLFKIAPEQKTFLTQFLFSYKLNPQTVLFLGYSDNYAGLHNFPLTQHNWAVFFKIGYALVL